MLTTTRGWIPPPLLRRSVFYLTSAASAWAIFNASRVYFVLGGGKMFLLESAVILLATVLVATALLNEHEEVPLDSPSTTMLAVVGVLSSVLFLSLYLTLLTFPFLSDDYVFIAQFRRLPDVMRASQFFRPLFAIVFLLLDRIGHGSSWPFHVLSILLHGGSALLVYSLGRRFFGGPAAAAIAFTLFLLNPLQLEAVLWTSGLQELLWTFFGLLTLHIHLRKATTGWPQIALAATALAAALLSKETAICLALLIPAADLTFFRFRRGPLLVRAYMVFAAVIAAYLILRSQYAGPTDNLTTPTLYFLKQLLSTPYRFFAQPWNTAAVIVPSAIAGLVALMWLALLSLVGLRRRPAASLLFAPMLIVISVLPLQKYFFVGADLTASRYIYFAGAGWALLVGGLVAAAIRDRPRVYTATAVLLAVASAGLLHGNVRPWRTVGGFLQDIALGVERGQQPSAAIATWQDTTGVTLNIRDGVPWDYQGVPIFINGYPEFLAMVREPRQ